MRDFSSVNFINLSRNPGEKSGSVREVPCVHIQLLNCKEIVCASVRV
jgi:hypothetical protein